MIRRSLAVALVLGLAMCPPAWACGGLFCRNTPVDQAGEKILFAADGQTVTAHVQIQYKGDAKDFSWVVPVPTEPKLDVGVSVLFTTLLGYSAPVFQAQGVPGRCGGQGPAPIEASAPAPTGATYVYFQGGVGPYEAAVLRSDDPGGLKAWLRANGYTIPVKLDPLLDPYVAGRYYFVALKLAKDKTVGDIQPIVMTYKATKPGIPLRLTGVAATPDMPIYVWVLGDRRAVPENYRHVRVNEARIAWGKRDGGYRDLARQAIDEAGGQAFVTDFAGKPDGAEAWFELVSDPALLSSYADNPEAFVEAVVNYQYFGNDIQQTLAFLARYAPKPADLADIDDQTFYQNSYQFQSHWKGQKVDTAAAIAELQRTAVAPRRALKDLFQRHRYLTALYTAMSPEEMTQDPLFVFNGELPPVAALRNATSVYHCEDPALRFDISLSNGLTYPMTREELRSAPRTAMPAAEFIEQLGSQGPPAIIQDNDAAIARALGVTSPPTATPTPVPAVATTAPTPTSGASPLPPTGFGCTGCSSRTAPPPAAGAGEGLAYGLVALGFLGVRLRAGRRR